MENCGSFCIGNPSAASSSRNRILGLMVYELGEPISLLEGKDREGNWGGKGRERIVKSKGKISEKLYTFGKNLIDQKYYQRLYVDGGAMDKYTAMGYTYKYIT
ncbi:conserved hypothetical protein [Ricinus communis]|uniref:Uncharacterized protein n=1 Tax=Ricinus communis TaxID=3988 RepID=B9S1I9_RICCO|nr:conserved hypothetical protein [Ricinus communis]